MKREGEQETEEKKRRKHAVKKRERESIIEKRRTSFGDRCASLSYLKNRQDSK